LLKPWISLATKFATSLPRQQQTLKFVKIVDAPHGQKLIIENFNQSPDADEPTDDEVICSDSMRRTIRSSFTVLFKTISIGI
jgi:hypothetical protein